MTDYADLVQAVTVFDLACKNGDMSDDSNYYIDEVGREILQMIDALLRKIQTGHLQKARDIALARRLACCAKLVHARVQEAQYCLPNRP